MSKYGEDEVVVDQLLRVANLGRPINVDSFLSFELDQEAPFRTRDNRTLDSYEHLVEEQIFPSHAV
jgi:hypothetical protein